MMFFDPGQRIPDISGFTILAFDRDVGHYARAPTMSTIQPGRFCMELTMTTPAIFFPAISLLLLAYSNRFLAIGSRVRSLYASYKTSGEEDVYREIESLKKRIILIRYMQLLGISAFFCCVLCIFLMFAGWETFAQWVFGASMLLLMASLVLSACEIHASITALSIHLGGFGSHKSGTSSVSDQ